MLCNVVTMYLRTTRTKTKSGPVEYVQLCHNYRHPETRVSRTEVIHSFGRADNLDIEQLRRLINSIARYLPSEEAAQIRSELGDDWPFEYLGSRDVGGTWVLDRLWRKLGIQDALLKLLESRGSTTPVERLLCAMVANRALARSSKLHVEHWVANEVIIDGLEEVDVHQLYRAMDFLLGATEHIQRQVFTATADLLNLEVDLLFQDTTSVCFELEEEADGTEDCEGLRKRSYSRDSRPDLPQVVLGFAVTRDGTPVRCWVWPGNTSDESIVEEVKRDPIDWDLGRVVMVQDTGFNSQANRRILRRTGGHYIIGEKLREGRKGS